ncbi:MULTISPECIES: helix-turn-helix domain-containing protein [Buttiauxella]|uniref:helix-turn-helix domain-containing protein n=1 Tax=Buttiauxella TaxID=82976 RepID=UPI001560E2D1|nr:MULTISPECIES: helix-turn-helix domain-containing protein [Buttiauxella]MCS3601664.1 hypothetical protein [Buttiauxella sp. BIGb0471]
MNNLQKTGKSNTYESSLIKPFSDINKLITILQPNSSNIATMGRQKINLPDSEGKLIYLLHEGSIALNRCNDGMIISSERAPFIFGLCKQITYSGNVFMRTQETSKISYLPLDKANEIITKNNLWEASCHIMMYIAARVFTNYSQLSQASSYEIIRHQLFELMNESTSVRNTVSAASYIKERTFLSRSGIMRILAELKAGGFIDIDKGLLKKVNQLPSRY